MTADLPLIDGLVESIYDGGAGHTSLNLAGETIVLLDHPWFLFQLRKDDRKGIIVIWIIFAVEGIQRVQLQLASVITCGYTVRPHQLARSGKR